MFPKTPLNDLNEVNRSMTPSPKSPACHISSQSLKCSKTLSSRKLCVSDINPILVILVLLWLANATKFGDLFLKHGDTMTQSFTENLLCVTSCLPVSVVKKTHYICYMPFHRNFTYWIDKRKWKYVFILATLELSRSWKELLDAQECDATTD